MDPLLKAHQDREVIRSKAAKKFGAPLPRILVSDSLVHTMTRPDSSYNYVGRVDTPTTAELPPVPGFYKDFPNGLQEKRFRGNLDAMTRRYREETERRIRSKSNAPPLKPTYITPSIELPPSIKVINLPPPTPIQPSSSSSSSPQHREKLFGLLKASKSSNNVKESSSSTSTTPNSYLGTALYPPPPIPFPSSFTDSENESDNVREYARDKEKEKERKKKQKRALWSRGKKGESNNEGKESPDTSINAPSPSDYWYSQDYEIDEASQTFKPLKSTYPIPKSFKGSTLLNPHQASLVDQEMREKENHLPNKDSYKFMSAFESPKSVMSTGTTVGTISPAQSQTSRSPEAYASTSLSPNSINTPRGHGRSVSAQNSPHSSYSPAIFSSTPSPLPPPKSSPQVVGSGVLALNGVQKPEAIVDDQYPTRDRYSIARRLRHQRSFSEPMDVPRLAPPFVYQHHQIPKITMENDQVKYFKEDVQVSQPSPDKSPTVTLDTPPSTSSSFYSTSSTVFPSTPKDKVGVDVQSQACKHGQVFNEETEETNLVRANPAISLPGKKQPLRRGGAVGAVFKRKVVNDDGTGSSSEDNITSSVESQSQMQNKILTSMTTTIQNIMTSKSSNKCPIVVPEYLAAVPESPTRSHLFEEGDDPFEPSPPKILSSPARRHPTSKPLPSPPALPALARDSPTQTRPSVKIDTEKKKYVEKTWSKDDSFLSFIPDCFDDDYGPDSNLIPDMHPISMSKRSSTYTALTGATDSPVDPVVMPLRTKSLRHKGSKSLRRTSSYNRLATIHPNPKRKDSNGTIMTIGGAPFFIARSTSTKTIDSDVKSRYPSTVSNWSFYTQINPTPSSPPSVPQVPSEELWIHPYARASCQESQRW